MKTFIKTLVILLALGITYSPAYAAKKARKIVSIQGRVSELKNSRDRKHKRYWEYKVKTTAGKTVLVHDYKYGQHRQPASAGISEGGKIKAKGFYVKIRTKKNSEARKSVFIIPSS